MAKATKVPVMGYTITLELTPDESQTLLGILEHIGGHGSRRADALEVAKALRTAGVHSNFEEEDVEVPNRAIYFKEKR